jgi:hypothetical protein
MRVVLTKSKPILIGLNDFKCITAKRKEGEHIGKIYKPTLIEMITPGIRIDKYRYNWRAAKWYDFWRKRVK